MDSMMLAVQNALRPPSWFTGLRDNPVDAFRQLQLFERHRTYRIISVNVAL